MVSDSHSHSVYQVSISNNGAFLQGTVSLVIKLPETANPLGLAFDGRNVYVANSNSDGGIIKFNLATSGSSIIVRNGTPNCHIVHGVDVSTDGILSLQTGDPVWCEVFRQEPQKFKWLLDLVQIAPEMGPA